MIVFRVDGNKNIGLGHVMRCLSIAVEFRNKGKECYFLIADNSCYDIIKAYDFSIEILHTDYVNMEEELTMTSLVLEKLSPEKVIIDSYFVTEHYLGTLRKKYCLVYIDDLASFAYPVDQLINYNIYGKDETEHD